MWFVYIWKNFFLKHKQFALVAKLFTLFFKRFS